MHKTIIFTIVCCATALAACGDDGSGRDTETLATADHPVALAFAPDGRLFFGEKFTGVIRIVGPDGKLLEEPFADLEVAEWLGLDWGLTGLAVPPDFRATPYLYAFYTERLDSSDEQPIGRPVLVRLEATSDTGGAPETVIGGFPQTQVDHQGFRANGPIHFGLDGTLYMAIGDYDFGKTPGPDGVPYAQDPAQPIGKILRVDANGDAVGSNPFADTPDADGRIFASGFARGADFAFHPDTGEIFGTDATDSCEEINLVTAGGNYGWPEVGEFPFADCNAGPGTKAIYLLAKPDTSPGEFLSFVGVSGMAYLDGGRYPTIGPGLLVCEKETGRMRLLALGGDGGDQVVGDDVIVDDCTGSVTVGPDGAIYYSNDSEVRRVVPEEG